MGSDNRSLPEGVFSMLDTDLYKLTMQCAVLKYFSDSGTMSAAGGRALCTWLIFAEL